MCVYGGKWMYEITLLTNGIQQVGWATLDTPFTKQAGVGDSPDSYAFDGSRVKKWNRGAASSYGEDWYVCSGTTHLTLY